VQILKDKIKDSICHAALDEFSEKGYEKASMREIAAKAGITAGNMYRYFKSKEDLFGEVLSPAHEKVLNLISYNIHAREKIAGSGNIVEEIAQITAEIYTHHRAELLILLNGSTGSRYQNYKQGLIELVKNRINETLFSQLKGERQPLEDEYLSRAMAASYLEGFIVLLKECVEQSVIQKLTKLLVELYFRDILHRFK